MLKIRKSPRIYGKPSEIRQAKLYALDKSEIAGKKPKGWNLKKSTYRVFVTLSYVIIRSPETQNEEIDHVHDVKNAHFNNYNADPTDRLDNRVLKELKNQIPAWERRDLRFLDQANPDAGKIFLRKWNIEAIKRLD